MDEDSGGRSPISFWSKLRQNLLKKIAPQLKNEDATVIPIKPETVPLLGGARGGFFPIAQLIDRTPSALRAPSPRKDICLKIIWISYKSNFLNTFLSRKPYFLNETCCFCRCFFRSLSPFRSTNNAAAIATINILLGNIRNLQHQTLIEFCRF